MKNASRREEAVWTIPVVLALMSALDLFTALISDSAGDVIAWLTLAVPVAVSLWYSRGLLGRATGQQGGDK